MTSIANELANVFIAYNLQSIVGEAKGAYDFISDQLGLVEKRLSSAEENLKTFKEKESVVELTEEAKVVLGMLSTVETGYNTTIARRQEAEARRDAVRRELETQAKVIKSSTTIAGNPLVQSLKGQLYDFEIELAGLLKVYSESTPEVEQMKTKITQTKQRLAKGVERIVTSEISSVNPVHQDLVSRLIQLEADVIACGAMAEAQKTFVEQYRAQLEKLPSKELQLARLTRDKNVSDQIYMMLMQRSEEAQLAQAIQIGNISVADPAIVPLYPYRPRRKLSLMLGAALGLMLGVGIAFFLESLDNTFRTEDEIKRCLNLPLLGTVPVIRYKPGLQALSTPKHDDNGGRVQSKALAKAVRLSEQESKMLTHLSPKAPETETYRMLVTNIQFAEVDNPIRTLLITSSTPGEGKTITATNLAIGMAQSGKKTLLVDTDLRKPMVHKLFQMDRSPGLTNFLLGKAHMQEVVRDTRVDNLSLITAGEMPPNAPQLLASQKMEGFIEELKKEFEIIIFDTPPATVVTDPAVLGAKLDATCLVVEAERTNKSAALKAKELLSTGNGDLLGVILNKISARKGYGGGYYYYYYYYYADEHEGDLKRGKGRRKRRKRG
jgi:tyrosine-protein kinase Etk/Wzc